VALTRVSQRPVTVVRPVAPPGGQNDQRSARQTGRQALTAPKEDKTATASAAHGFADHLREAIAVNRSRRDFYAERTGGRSRLLSTTLITLETLSLPWAMYLDRQARPFA